MTLLTFHLRTWTETAIFLCADLSLLKLPMVPPPDGAAQVRSQVLGNQQDRACRGPPAVWCLETMSSVHLVLMVVCDETSRLLLPEICAPRWMLLLVTARDLN
jgi:hypothetical protein